MKKLMQIRTLVLAAVVALGTLGAIQATHLLGDNAEESIMGNLACEVYGKVKIVDYGEDYKVKRVDYGQDLKVKWVDYGEDNKGKWKRVDYGQKYKIKWVDYGEDFKVKFVDYGEGC